MKALVLFYSTYGHIWKMAEAAAAGVREGRHVASLAGRLAVEPVHA